METFAEVAYSVGKGKEVEGVWGKSKKVPMVKIVDAEVVASACEEELRKWVEEAEREFDVLQGKWQGK